jgi:transmembrane sensor
MDANDRRERATQEAAAWWNRLAAARPGEMSRSDREVFTNWLRESPLHIAELLRIAQVHDALDRFKGWAGIEGDEADGAGNVVALHAGREVPGEAGRAGRRAHPGFWAIAASTVLFALVAGWLALEQRGVRIETDLAERRQVMLDDGTVVQLEPETRLRVRLEDRERNVGLEQGRALFRVAKDAQRPFRVSTQHTSVRAVGTAFGVETAGGDVIVTVAEGKVAVERPREATKQGAGADDALPALDSEIFLTAGQQLRVESSGAVDPVQSVDTTRALAWAQGQLVFENDTLADVVAQFNRYNRTQLRISDARLTTRRVSGVFDATDTETLLAFIRQAGSGIAITRTDEGIVIGSDE